MSDRATNDGAVGVTIAVLVLVLLLALGGGVYSFRHSRQQQLLAMVERERAAAAQAASLVRNSNRAQPTIGEFKAGIESVLRKQVAAWNSGNIDEFMDYYLKSDDLTFSSGGKTTRGWSATLENYKQRYPTTEQMGEVQFADIEIMPLGDGAALVLGFWRLARASDPLKGNFSLVFRKVEGRWLISHDHTSRLTE